MKRGMKRAFLIIVNLVLSVIAFSFILGMSEVDLVSGQTAITNIAASSAKSAEYTPYKLESSYEFTAKSTVNGVETSGKIATDTLLKSGNDWYIQSQGQFVKLDPANLQQLKNLGVDVTKLKTDITGPKIFGWQPGFAWGHIIQGAIWAVAAAGAAYLIGSLFGLKTETTAALAKAAAGGVFFGKAAYGIFGKGGWAGTNLPSGLWGATGIGIVIGLFILELTYKKEWKKIVTFECYPWEAPAGGENCEKCNSDLYPCSEYRCKSLGQACQLLNPGTGQAKCAWVNPKDVNSPIIQASKEDLTSEHEYIPNNAIRPPDRGVKIKYKKSTDGCVKAFTPLSFGITVNEPAQCKIDYNRTNNFDEMKYYFGESNIYKYNHTQTLRLPGPDALNAEAPELKADGTYNLYVRCKDANNNTNADMFVFSFCVEKGPDVTAPKIESTNIANDMPFQYGLNETNLEVYVNEPADCKWSKLDMDYDDMETTMTCSQHVYEMNNLMLYKCATKLTGLLDRQDNIFYFKCRDQPYLKGTDKENNRNTNSESYKFTLKGTQPLTITSVKPNETIKGAGTLATVYLDLETDNGYNLGDSWCSYSTTTSEKDYIQMYETGTNKHKQRLDLASGNYTYYFQCVDLGGNSAWTNTTFSVEIDNAPPLIVRVYKDGEKLKVITDEKSNCAYSNNEDKKCNFQISEGTSMPYINSTEHYASWLNKNYYIKCADLNGRQPLPNECSIIAKPQS